MITKLFRWLFGKGCEHKYKILEHIVVKERWSETVIGYEYVSQCEKCGKITVKSV